MPLEEKDVELSGVNEPHPAQRPEEDSGASSSSAAAYSQPEKVRNSNNNGPDFGSSADTTTSTSSTTTSDDDDDDDEDDDEVSVLPKEAAIRTCRSIQHTSRQQEEDHHPKQKAPAQTEEGYRLDPEDWDEYRAQLHQLVDVCCDRMQSYRDLPWQPPDSQLLSRERLAVDANAATTASGRPLSNVVEQLVHHVMPAATGNTHPQFMGWVHGAGLPACAAAELVAATMNSNCGGRHHGAAAVEQACVEYLCRTAGYYSNDSDTKNDNNNKSSDNQESPSQPPQSPSPQPQPFGVLTSGTSQATIYALLAARTRLLGYQVRQTGIAGLPKRLVVYCQDAAHSCLSRAMECLGHGSNSVVRIPIDPVTGAMNVQELEAQLQRDLQTDSKVQCLAIVGTAGSVTVGAYDDLERLGRLAAQYQVWFHVDAAFGFWTRTAATASASASSAASQRIRNLTTGLERADSIALDAHKWPGVNYDCGALLVRNGPHLRRTLATRPAYLQSNTTQNGGLAAGDVWFTDYSLELSRGFRALKLWTALQVAGTDAIGQVVVDNCQQAAHMAALVQASPHLELAHAVISNVCCFQVVRRGERMVNGNNNNNNNDNDDDYFWSMPEVANLAARLQLQGQAVFSTVTLDDHQSNNQTTTTKKKKKACLRAALVNHRATQQDITQAIAAVEQAVVEMQEQQQQQE